MADKIAKRGVSIFIDGKEVENSVKSIKSEMKALQNEQAKLIVGSEKYIASGKKIAYLNSLLDEHKKKTLELQREYKSLWQRSKETFGGVSDWLNRNFISITSFIGMITGVSLAFRKLSEDIAHMDDVYSDVMKTTGMTKDEVKSLNDQFKKTDTRTSREELNKIAEAGGRIGIAKENIYEFTKAMDIANVSLGDSFTGGVEEIATKLGKLKMLFKETKDEHVEKAYLAIGSAINDLGANGAASEVNISEFALRVGSLPDALKPSIADTLALGAAFEESGIEAEISSRAYNIFLKQASTESAKFAKVMNTSTQEVEKMINTNPMDFFLKFAEGMKGMNATEVAKTLDYLGVNADGANKAIGAAANNTARFRELIELSNKSFVSGTSVINEYNIKNNNLQAQLLKARKAFNETALELGEKLSPALLVSTKGTTYLIKSLVELLKWLKENKGLIITLATVMGIYTIAVNASRIATWGKIAVDKAKIIVDKISTASTLLAAAAQAIFTGNTTRAAAAMRLLNAQIMINPYVAFGVALAVITVALYKLIKGQEQSFSIEKSRISIQENANKQYDEQASKIDVLVAKIHNENLSNAERKKAIEDLKAIIPEYNGMLDKEGKLINDNKTAIDNYLISLEKQIKMKATQEEWENIIREKRKQDKIVKQTQDELNRSKQTNSSTGEVVSGGEIGIAGQVGRIDAVNVAQGKLNKELQKQAEITKTQLDLEKEIKTYTVSTTKSDSPKEGDTKQIGKDWYTYKGGKWVKDEVFTPYSKSGSNTENKIATEEKKKLNDALKKLDTDNNTALAEIHRKYINDEIESEEVKNEMLLAQQRKYINDQIKALDELAKTTTDDGVKEEILNKKSELNNQLLQMDVAAKDKAVALEMKNAKDKADIAERAEKFGQEALEKEKEKAQQRLELLDKYEISTLKDKKQAELEIIEKFEKENVNFHDDAIKIKKKLDDKYFRESLDKYAEAAGGIANIAGDIQQSLSTYQSIEEDRVNRKYAKQIKAAQKAGKDTTKIEEQKEKELAAIRAREADKTFIVTAASIIAKTAEGAISAFTSAVKWGGIPAGVIAAAAASAYGFTQLAQANEQREAAKEGYYWGGFTGSGDPTKTAGYLADGSPVHEQEFILNHWGVRNPNILPVVTAFDQAQRNGTISTMSKADIAKALNISGSQSANNTSIVNNTNSTDAYVIGTISKLEKTMDKLSKRLDEGIEATAVVSGKNGIAKKLTDYNNYVKNARG